MAIEKYRQVLPSEQRAGDATGDEAPPIRAGQVAGADLWDLTPISGEKPVQRGCGYRELRQLSALHNKEAGGKRGGGARVKTLLLAA